MSPVYRQFLAIGCCNLLALSFGLSNFWATINLLELENANSTYLTEPLNQQESALVISLANVGGFLGNFIILPISQIIGIKRTIHILCIPLIISAVLTIWAKNAFYLYISRVLTGLVGGGVVVGLPMLINDISSDSVRGALNSLYDPFNNCGIIISFLIGSYLSCVDQAKVQLIPPIIFMIALFFLPETPEYWTSRNRQTRAIKANRFYRGSLVVQPNKTDFHLIPQSEKHEKDEKIEKGIEKCPNEANESNEAVTFKDFCTPHAKKSLFISFTLLILGYLSGTISIIAYVTYIFKETGSTFSEKHSSILISITQLAANLVFLNIVERFNRRTLYIWSSLLTMASYFLFGAYGIFWLRKPGFEWMPIFCFASIIYFSCMGLRPIPYIVTMEIFPKKIRKTCSTLAVSLLWIILFILGAVFLTFLELFGLFNCMLMLGVISLLNALFGIFFVPETRGKSYEEIEEIMNK